VKAVVLLSGGMDSATTLALAVKEYGPEEVLAIIFDYGQLHAKELVAALALASHYNVKHKKIIINLRQIGGSALTASNIPVPKFEEDEDVWERTGSALTYVPMRNTIFIALAAAVAETIGAYEIWTGFNFIDSGGYPDTRPEYVEAINEVLRVGSRDKPKVVAPLINLTKAQIVELGQRLHVPWELTWSCYKGGVHPCGECNACVQRRKGFQEAHVKDPLNSPSFSPLESFKRCSCCGRIFKELEGLTSCPFCGEEL